MHRMTSSSSKNHQAAVVQLSLTIDASTPTHAEMNDANVTILGEKRSETSPTQDANLSEPMPWDDAHPKVKIPFQARLPEHLHMKMHWISQRTMGGRSLQDIVLTAIEEYCDREVARELGSER